MVWLSLKKKASFSTQPLESDSTTIIRRVAAGFWVSGLRRPVAGSLESGPATGEAQRSSYWLARLPALASGRLFFPWLTRPQLLTAPLGLLILRSFQRNETQTNATKTTTDETKEPFPKGSLSRFKFFLIYIYIYGI